MSHEKSWDISVTHSWQYFLHRFTSRQDVPGELYTVHCALRGHMCAVSHWQHSRETNNEIKASAHPMELAGCWKTPWTAEMLPLSTWSRNLIRNWDAEDWLSFVWYSLLAPGKIPPRMSCRKETFGKRKSCGVMLPYEILNRYGWEKFQTPLKWIELEYFWREGKNKQKSWTF